MQGGRHRDCHAVADPLPDAPAPGPHRQRRGQGAPALAGQFILPRTGAPHRYFLTAAKAMLDRAVEFKEVLLAHGLGATLIDGLTKALAEFDTTTAAASPVM